MTTEDGEMIDVDQMVLGTEIDGIKEMAMVMVDVMILIVVTVVDG